MRRFAFSATVATVATAALALLAAPARATWSIVITNSATGEVAVGGATCLAQLDLKRFLPAVRVGVGAGVTQALLDDGSNKVLIWDELGKGNDPAAILTLLQQKDLAFEDRQFGIVRIDGLAVTNSGLNNAAFAGGVTGTLGPITYAIQGNILTGAPVVLAAEQALVNTPGDVAEKLMAAMEAARSFGGDGRCSCSPQAPTSCGSPPPTFTKSAHVGFMIVSRVGDVEGNCSSTLGCANGVYYMLLNVKGLDGQPLDPDPVLQLEQKFVAWRAGLEGRPDHVKSQVHVESTLLSADGTSSATLRIELADWKGQPLTRGGALVTVSKEPGSGGAVSIGPVIDHGDGSYTAALTATSSPALDVLRVTVDDGKGLITLYPFTSVGTVSPTALAAAPASISTLQGDDVLLTFDGGPALAQRPYVLLCSLSGSTPGFDAGGVHVPLALDAAVAWSYALCASPVFMNGCGVLDAQGLTAATLKLDPLTLRPEIGGALTFALLAVDPLDYVSGPVTVAIAP